MSGWRINQTNFLESSFWNGADFQLSKTASENPAKGISPKCEQTFSNNMLIKASETLLLLFRLRTSHQGPSSHQGLAEGEIDDHYADRPVCLNDSLSRHGNQNVCVFQALWKELSLLISTPTLWRTSDP